MCHMPITMMEDKLSSMIELYETDPSTLRRLSDSVDEWFDIAMSCLEAIIGLQGQLSAFRNCVDILMNVIKGYNRAAVRDDEVFAKVIDLLSQNSENSNWSPSTSHIKNYGTSAKKCREQHAQTGSKVAELGAKAEKALALVGICLSLSNPWCKQADNAGQSTGTPSQEAESEPVQQSDHDTQDNSALSQEGAEEGMPGNGAQAPAADEGSPAPQQDGGKPGKRNRPKSGKKPGGQEGHDGSNLKTEQPATHTITNIPKKCMNCPNRETCAALKGASKKDRRRMVDMAIMPTFTDSFIICLKCPMTKEKMSGDHPEEFRAREQYGINVRALVVCLFALGYMSLKRIQGFLRDLIGVSPSTATISAFIARAARRGAVFWDYIRQMVRAATVANSDETSAYMLKAGKIVLNWIHTVTTENFTYLYCSEHRGFSAIEEDGVLVDYLGTLVHDCFGSYWKLNSAVHALCGAHLLRELTAVLERDPEDTWANELADLLREMVHRKETLLSEVLEKCCNGKLKLKEGAELPRLSQAELDSYFARYLEIIKRGFERYNYPFDPNAVVPCAEDEEESGKGKGKKRGRKAKPKTVNLLIRLRDHMKEWLQFIVDFSVPFTNNAAERSLRGLKVHQNVSHFLRTPEGLTIRMILSSITQSARQNGLSGFKAICSVIAGESPEEFFGVKVPEEIREKCPDRKKEPNLPDPDRWKKKKRPQPEEPDFSTPA